MPPQSSTKEPQVLGFAALPLDKNGPHGNAWGRWGPSDQLGTLNFLTDDVVAKAVSECVKTGQRTSLNWTLEGPAYPRFQRKTLSLKTINKAPLKHAHDDELYYMGRTAEQFAASTEPNGVQHVAQRGIAGRAVFADWYAWALKQGKQIDATSSYAVPFSEILEPLESQGFKRKELRKGDILIIRFGYLRQYADMDENKRQRLDDHYKTHKPVNIGVEPSE